jgi:hypothetical protein
MSDTPRTDVESWRENRTEVVTADFARQLERELAELRAATIDPKRQVVCMIGEYKQLAFNSRRYEWLRDHMRRMPMGRAGTRHFFDQPGTMSFQEAVDEAIRALKDKP